MNFRKTLFINPPSWQGFDGGAGSRYQAKREIRSFWFPTWLAQPAALIEGSRLVDAPPHDQTRDDVLRIARDYELVDHSHERADFARRRGAGGGAQVAEPASAGRLRRRARGGAAGAKRCAASEAIDFVGAQGVRLHLPRRGARASRSRRSTGCRSAARARVVHNPERALIADFDELPSVMDVYARDLEIERYFIGYLQASLRLALHRPRLPGAVHVLPLAADRRRAQVSREIAGGRGARDGARAAALPAGEASSSSTTTPSPPTSRAPARSRSSSASSA